MKNSLPPQANASHLKKQAKALLKGFRNVEKDATRRIAQYHPSYGNGVPAPDSLNLQEAQHVIALEYGSTSWPSLMKAMETPPQSHPEDSSGILLYTNGQAAIELLDTAGIQGYKFEWTDLLHDGPVPHTETHEKFVHLRAQHLSSLGFLGYDGFRNRFEQQEKELQHPDHYRELQLWFEHDLFDQLLLAQLICRISEIPEWIPKTRLLQFDTFIGSLSPDQLASTRPEPQVLNQGHLREASQLWDALRSDTPTLLEQAGQMTFQSLPFASAAIDRLCEEYPSIRNGLPRTEQQILQGLDQGLCTAVDLFRFNQEIEEARFMGDASFYLRLENLTNGPSPCVLLENATQFLHPSLHGYTDAFRNQTFRLTTHGRKILSGESNYLNVLPTPYWIGGVQIQRNHGYCWDSDSEVFVEKHIND